MHYITGSKTMRHSSL